jgi:hypothetical protein
MEEYALFANKYTSHPLAADDITDINEYKGLFYGQL